VGPLTDRSPFVKPEVSPVVAAGDTWEGASIGWQYELEHGLRMKWPGDVRSVLGPRWVWPAKQPSVTDRFERAELPVIGRVLTYHHAGLPVLGRTGLVPVTVEFHQYPTYDSYGLPWHDYPRVFADPGAASKHRMPDDALCLYFPWDPPERRWRYENGLVQLFDVVADHLHKELWWRHTGGDPDGEWPGEDAEHGVPDGSEQFTRGGIAL